MIRRSALVLLLLQCALVSGCFSGNSDPPMPKDAKPTYPVSGILHIDGKPTEGVNLFVNTAATNLSVDQSTPIMHAAAGITDTEGKFSFSTYYANDGLPEGSYVISFYWADGVVPILIGNYDEPPTLGAAANKFNEKYGVPATSEIKFTVEKDKPLDLGVLDLKTK